ncbi:Zn(2)-C6 fungal-type transcription factor [Pseudohyphozyma bogoriensis]|nr:Zn(2)-C6 fungal-type transcription factor [Pseudohyphozyma bogoriensis]
MYSNPQYSFSSGVPPVRPLSNLSGSTAASTYHPAVGSGTSSEEQSPQADKSDKQSKSAGGAGKRARASVADSEDEGDEGDGKKKQRVRQALSCGECKRRKIKCDRKLAPLYRVCEERETRRMLVGGGQDRANAATRRLASVEAFLQSLPPELRAGAPTPQIQLAGSATYDRQGQPVIMEKASPEEDDGNMSDTEEETLKLEQLARGNLAPSFAPALPPTTTYAEGAKPEYTSALTSIIAQPISPEADFSGCLEFGIPLAEIPAA